MSAIKDKIKRGIPLFNITLQRLIKDKKTKLIIFLSLLPLLIVVLIKIYNPNMLDSKEELADEFTNLTRLLFFTLFFVLFAILEATSLINEESKNKTYSYLLIRSISRFDLVIYKYLAFLVLSFFVVSIPLICLYCLMASVVSVSAFFIHIELLFYFYWFFSLRCIWSNVFVVWYSI